LPYFFIRSLSLGKKERGIEIKTREDYLYDPQLDKNPKKKPCQPLSQ
jgi:hypothetical protein